MLRLQRNIVRQKEKQAFLIISFEHNLNFILGNTQTPTINLKIH